MNFVVNKDINISKKESDRPATFAGTLDSDSQWVLDLSHSIPGHEGDGGDLGY